MDKEFVADVGRVLAELSVRLKQELATDARTSIILGIVSYSFRLAREIEEHRLEDTVAGRALLRGIAEALLNLKYLELRESDDPDIWIRFRDYGLGKYKLVLLKARESSSMEPDSHFVPLLIDSLVNEHKWEAFTDIDLGAFDKLSIRERAELVGEKAMFDTVYDYDTNFVHGFWGAIRESALLLCDNPAHRFHVIPDASGDQKLKSVAPDAGRLLGRTIDCLSRMIDLPLWFRQKHASQ